MNKQKVEKVSVALSPDIIEWLDEEAAKRRTNRSQVIREHLLPAMEESLRKEGEQGGPPTRVHGRTGARGQSSLTSSASARRRPDRPPKSQKQPLFSGVVMTNE